MAQVLQEPLRAAAATTPPVRLLAPIDDLLSELPPSDAAAAGALRVAFESQRDELAAIERYFARLTSRAWSRPTLERAMRGWHDIHPDAASTAAVGCRLLLLAENAQTGDSASHFWRAAAEIARLTHADVGLAGPTRAEQFERLADFVCDGDGWRSHRNQTPSAQAFHAWVQAQRIGAIPLDEAITITIAAELCRHAERAHLLAPVSSWLLRDFGHPPATVRKHVTWLEPRPAHGDRAQVQHALDALKHCHRGTGSTIDLEALRAGVERYVMRTGAALRGLDARLH